MPNDDFDLNNSFDHTEPGISSTLLTALMTHVVASVPEENIINLSKFYSHNMNQLQCASVKL